MTMLFALAAAAVQCPNSPGWTTPTNVRAVVTRDNTIGLKTGKAYRIALAPIMTLRPVTTTKRMLKPGTWSGIAALDVTARGKLTVILSSATYVDLVRDDITLPSIDHSKTKGCVGIHKTVTFDVVPGRYLVQFTDAPDRTVTVEAVLG